MKIMLDSIQCGDSASLLKQLPDKSVDLVVTSPPYYLQRAYNDSGLSIGQEKIPEHYLDALLETFAECVRITKPEGNIVYNVGDKYLKGSLMLLPFRFAMMASDMYPVKLVNEITWVKRNPTPRQFTRRLVSSTEPFFHFAVGDNYYYDRDSFCEEGQETINSAPSPRLGMKYRHLIEESKVLSNNQKQLAHRELNEVIDDVRKNRIHSFRMKIKGIHAEAFGGQDGGRKGQMEKKGFTIIRIKGGKIKRDVIESKVESLPGNIHTAIFPLSIIRELIRLLSPEGGLVVDPYIGSGTTAVAAILESRRYFGIDIDPDYCVSAKNRVLAVKKQETQACLLK